MRPVLVILFVFLADAVFAQVEVDGRVVNSNKEPIVGASILLLTDSTGTTTDMNGHFRLLVQPGNEIFYLRISHVQYETKVLTVNYEKTRDLKVVLIEQEELLKELQVVGGEPDIISVSSIRINPKSFRLSPVPFQDISNIIATLPSVTSNNELSSAYSVRGGSYDENLVLVNGIPVYRPFLVRSGQEEGLSFVNTDLVSAVSFSAGGWPVIYDDKMASVLSATYKEPEQFGGSAMISLLGAKANLEGKIGHKFSYLVGVRHKRSAYLLNTLNIEGDYRPTFTDAQALIRYDFSDKTSLETLLAHANNNYTVLPSTSTTSFGTFVKELRLLVAFDGKQQMRYHTYQGALKLNHKISENLKWTTLASLSSYAELENIDLEGGYRLCDVDKNLGSSTFNECIAVRGIGTLYNYARNRLSSTLIDAESSLTYALNTSQHIRAGLGYSKQLFNDRINEFELIDSADYVSVIGSVLAENETDANQIKIFVQHMIELDSWSVTYGARANYNTINKYLLVSPRVLVGFHPVSLPHVRLNFGAGIYGQQPFYKEFRRTDGSIKTDIKGQSSFHLNLGMEHDITWWGRTFILTSELYYKFLWNQVPYIIENVRQQYFPDYTATGKSIGFEARLGGEFIPGTESWFSIGLMSTKERIPGIDKDFIRRPADQRFKVAFVFEDHIPGDPSLRVNLAFQYGSGLPISPPDAIELRNSFAGDDYSRLDIGFSKIFSFKGKWLKTLRLGAEINNLLGSRNAVSYTWIQDVYQQKFAVPNYLTGRLFNAVITTRF